MLPQIQHETHWEKIRKFFWYVGQLLALVYLCVFIMVVCSYKPGFTLNIEPHNHFGEMPAFDTRSLGKNLPAVKNTLETVASKDFCNLDVIKTDAEEKRVCFYESPTKYAADDTEQNTPLSNEIFTCKKDGSATATFTEASRLYKIYTWDSSIGSTPATLIQFMKRLGNAKWDFVICGDEFNNKNGNAEDTSFYTKAHIKRSSFPN